MMRARASAAISSSVLIVLANPSSLSTLTRLWSIEAPSASFCLRFKLVPFRRSHGGTSEKFWQRVDMGRTFGYFAKYKHLENAVTDQEKNLIEAKAKVLKALAHPTRLWISEQLSEGEKCVCEFVDQLDADFSTVSKHLSVLKQSGIIESDKRGKQVYYTLKVPCVLSFMSCVEAVIESNAKEQAALVK